MEVMSVRKGKYRLKRRVKRKLNFYYKLYEKKQKIFKLKVKMVNSNFFITLTDYNDKVIVYKSTGQVSENRKKKVKLSPYLVTKMMSSILYRLRKNKIKLLFFFVNSKINRHVNNVMKSLKTIRRIRILKVLFSKPLAHHLGTRKPKLRRL
jgi:ribosomal protein S11